MTLKKLFITSIAILLLAGCSKDDFTLTDAINLARDGVAMIEQSKAKDIEISESKKLLADGTDKTNQALAIYATLLERQPQNGQYHNNLGWLQMKIGKLDDAQMSFDAAEKNRGDITPPEALDANIAYLKSITK